MYKTIQARHGMLQSGLQKVLDAQYEKGWEYIGSHGDELIFKRREKPVLDSSTFPGLRQYLPENIPFLDLDDAKENFKEVEKGPPCVVDCGEHGYFKIWGNWPNLEPPTFTHNLEEAFKYSDVPGIFNYLQDIRDELERQGYEAVIRKVKELQNVKTITS